MTLTRPREKAFPVRAGVFSTVAGAKDAVQRL